MQITPNIHVLNLPFIVPLPTGHVERSVNIVIICSDTVTLIDSGTAGSEQRIFDYLRSIGRLPEEISLLILTHSHPDHIGAAQAITAATGCQIAAHDAELPWIEDVGRQCEERPVPGFRTLVGGSVKVADAGTLDIGGLHLKVMHTPGHSQGSLSLWCPDESVLITGDALPVPNEMPIFDSHQESLESLRRLKDLNADWVISAWEQPLRGADIQRRFSSSNDWLMKIQDAVSMFAEGNSTIAPMDLCAQVVASLKLPPFAVNPLVARSLTSCLK